LLMAGEVQNCDNVSGTLRDRQKLDRSRAWRFKDRPLEALPANERRYEQAAALAPASDAS